MRNNSIADHVDCPTNLMMIQETKAKPDADGVVIAMSSRNSIAIKAKLKPLLYEERVDKTSTLLENLSNFEEGYKKTINRRKSMSKRVTQSFTVDNEMVQRKVVGKTHEENLPSNRYLKAAKIEAKKKVKGKVNQIHLSKNSKFSFSA